jgi:hypothetical protein
MESIDERIAVAPLPTRETIKLRSNLLLQAIRFAVINLKMIRIIVKSH